MLFDLRGPGRRRTIKVIYSSLAVLMGVGLVLFGIGGAVSGGLFDAFNGGGSTSSGDAFKAEITRLNKRIAANPSDPAALAELARTRTRRPARAATTTRPRASSRRTGSGSSRR